MAGTSPAMTDKVGCMSDLAKSDIEEGLAFAPKFDADGLVSCVATDAKSGDVLMVAHMNAQALAKTIETGEAWYFSRSRKALWKKGESSGHVQHVREIYVDCDADCVLMKVEQTSAACHEGYRSCFFRRVEDGEWRVVATRVAEPDHG